MPSINPHRGRALLRHGLGPLRVNSLRVTARHASAGAASCPSVPNNPNTVAIPLRASAPADLLKASPTTHASPGQNTDEFWRKVPVWKDVSARDFLSWSWSSKNAVERKETLVRFLQQVLPDSVPRWGSHADMQTREDLIMDIVGGMKQSSMSIRAMPYILSRVNWENPVNDPIFRQFIPLASAPIAEHPQLKLDSLHEQEDSPVDGIVHRYPDKALFLAVSVCPTNCTFCTRSYGVGADTESVSKTPFRPAKKRLQAALDYISNTPQLNDIVISGGDGYYLPPHIIEWIGDSLLSMPNIERFRFASKGLAVAPQRFLDEKDDWTDALIRLSDRARQAGKHMALHTHFNHPNEISWVTEQAALKLLRAGVNVRNQSVLLRGVNDNVETMSTLIRKLAKMAIQPYYVYQCDMVPNIEHLRTPLKTILNLESQIRGSIAGFYMPNFVVDLPEGGGKRLACSYKTYNQETGVSTFEAPALTGEKTGKIYHYYDPVNCNLEK